MSKPKSRFISYLTQSIPDRSARKSSFKSYIEDAAAEGSNSVKVDDYNVTDDVEECASQFFDQNLNPHLMPGESVLAEAENTLKFAPYSNGKQGMSGILCCTNFKLSFVTADRSSYDQTGQRNRNKILADDDIPLCCIDAIYQVNSSGKRKKMTLGSRTTSKTELLEIHCKDLRIHTFSFKFTPKSQNKQFVNILVHHSYPAKPTLLFAYEYGRNNMLTGRQLTCDTPTYDTIMDWEDELRRCKADRTWRVTDVNMNFDLSQSLPKYFVVPSALLNADLQRAAPHFTNRRIPTWCYTHLNGNSLVRMSAAEQDSDQPQQSKRLLDAVKVAGNHRNSPKVVAMADICPSCKEIQESFIKLKKLCMSDSEREFVLQDMTWLTSLDTTKWLQLVVQCLTACNGVVELIVASRRTVALQEQSGCDLSCLVSSVVQILLDPHYRTLIGFQALIEKEWVRMGHPFQQYLSLVVSGDADTEQVPIFLLFLDCVWQLLQQFPSEFEYTETFLTTIWDTVHVGIFDTFLFNNDNQRGQFSKNQDKNIKQFRLPSAWKWDLQLKAEDLSFFRNPLYLITHDDELVSSMKDLHDCSLSGEFVQSARKNKIARAKSLEQKLKSGSNSGVKFSQDGKEIIDVLTPQTMAPAIHLWTQCYLRWQTPAQILSGGTPSLYLQQCHMVEEIVQLQHKVNVLQLRSSSDVAFRPRSDLIFGHQHQEDTRNITELLNSTIVTSSFPFSPGPALKELSLPPISAYLRHSSLDWDYADAED